MPLFSWAVSSPRASRPPGYTVVESPAQMVVLDAAADTLWWMATDKFRNGRPAAVSITYDAPFGTHPKHHLATAAVLQRDLRLDLELVSAIYLTPRWRHLTDYYRTELMPQGIRFFGHGHTHALHDTMTFDAAYESFRTNFLLMQAWGLGPKGYAYPGSSGLRRSTQAANRTAGFYAGGTARRFRIGLDDGLPDSLYSEPLTMRLCGGGSQLALDGPGAAAAHVLDDGCLRFDALPDGSVYELTVGGRQRHNAGTEGLHEQGEGRAYLSG